MKSHEFHHLYANVPLAKRFMIINSRELGMMTLTELCHRIKTLEDEIRPKQIEIERLLRVAKVSLPVPGNEQNGE